MAKQNKLTKEERKDHFKFVNQQMETQKKDEVNHIPEFSGTIFVFLMIIFFPAAFVYQSVILAKAQVSMAKSLLEVANTINSKNAVPTIKDFWTKE